MTRLKAGPVGLVQRLTEWGLAVEQRLFPGRQYRRVRLSGEITGTSMRPLEKLHTALGGQCRVLEVDLSRVSLTSHAGACMMLMVVQAARKNDAVVLMTHPTPACHRALTGVGMHRASNVLLEPVVSASSSRRQD